MNFSQQTLVCALAFKADWLPGHKIILIYNQFYHGSSLLTTMHLNVALGCTTFTMKDCTLEKLLLAIQECKPNGFWTTPWIASSMIKESSVDHYDMSSLEWVSCSGAIVSKDMCILFWNGLGFPAWTALEWLNLWFHLMGVLLIH